MEVYSTEVELLEIRFGQKGFRCVDQLGEDFGHEMAVPPDGLMGGSMGQ